MAHTTAASTWGTAIFTGWTPPGRLSSLPVAVPDDEDPVQAVLRFRASVAPETFELARYLSAAPLNLPVMRLVQSAMLPRSRPRHLAEFFLSDLLRRRTPYAEHQDAEAVVYDFRKGIRQVLAASLGPDTGLHILTKVSKFISQRFGAALDFPAILAGAGVPTMLDEASRPFAEVAQGVLYALGGQYRALARQLTVALQRQNSGGSLTMPGDVSATARPLPARSTHPGGTVITPTAPLHQEADQSPAQPAVWGGVPPKNPNFTGRVELLAQLREQLNSKVTALLPHTLQGLGGVGKTQLAVEYAHRYASEYELVWWVPSEQSALIRQSLVLLAPKLGLLPGAGEDISQTLTAINDRLRLGQPFQRWLLVFDNADRAEDVAPFLSNPGGHVLITSRNRGWSSVAQMIEVDVFERDESIALLRRRLPQISQTDADRLADRLGDLPLALEQAAAWQVATAMTAREYLDLLDQQIGVLMSEEKPLDYPRPVGEAWGIAFQQLTERAPAALQMLELCAFMGSEPISVRLLRTARLIASQLPQPLGAAVADEIPLHRAIRDIDRYGLAKIDPARPSIQVHRLVQAVLRDRMTIAERETYLAGVHALLAAANPADPDDEQNWARQAELSPHIVPAKLVEGSSSDVRRVVLDQVRYRWVQGDFAGSQELAELAVEHWRRVLGQDDQYTLQAGRLLAIAERSLGNIARGRELNEQLYEQAKISLGPEHEHTLSIGNSRGADLRLIGHWREALELDERLFLLHKQVYGLDDRNTFRAANNLAVDYRLLGQFELALEVDKDNERRLEAVLGKEHPDLLRTKSNLSRDYYGLGDYTRALEIQRQSLPIHRRVLGDDHYEVLKATRIHVATLRKTGSPVEAYQLARDLVAHSSRRLGESHPDSLSSTMTLSNCLASIGEFAKAKISGEDAEAGFRDLLGPNHPFTMVTSTNVATVLRLLVEHPAARRLDEQAVAGFEGTLGPDHHYTYCATMNLANDVAVAGEYQRSLELTQRALDGLTTTYGAAHPQTVVCRHNLAIDLEETGDLAQARMLRQELQRQFRDIFGPTHPETLLWERRRRASIEIEPPNW